MRTRKLTTAERAADLVRFSEVMLRRKLHPQDAQCLIDNWASWKPGATRFVFDEGDDTMAKKARKTARKTAKKAKVSRKADLGKPGKEALYRSDKTGRLSVVKGRSK